MLIHYNPDQPLYIFGEGRSAREIQYWIKQESNNEIDSTILSVDQFYSLPANSQVILGFSDMQHRQRLFSSGVIANINWVSYFHDSSVITHPEKIGRGTIIRPMVVIGYDVTIGDFCWITTMSQIGHGSSLGRNVIVNQATSIAGATQIGNNVLIGMCSSIKDRITIGDNVEFIMRSIVTKDIVSSGKYYGNRKIS